MATANTQATGIGLRHVRVALRDTDGTIKVPAGTSAGTAYAGIQVAKAKALTVTLADPQRIAARGDDANFHTFNEAPTDSPSGELRTAVTDTEVIALLTSVKRYGSGERREVMLGTNKLGEEDAVMMWGYRKAIDAEVGSATYGLRVYQTYIFLNCYATVRPATMEDSQVGETTYAVTANNSSVDQFGRTLTEAIHGCTEAPFIIVQSRYKYWLDAFVGDNVETDFTLTKTTQTKVGVSTSPTELWVAGASATFTCTAGGVLTPTSKPTLGQKVIVGYEFED